MNESDPPAPVPTPDRPDKRKRRPRYSGRNPRKFHEKYKELNPEHYAADVQKVLESGKTPAGSHRPIMVDEVLHALAPRPGEVAVDCTLGGGGHAHAILDRLRPGGRLIGLDVDPLELPRTEAKLRAAGFGADEFSAWRSNFAGLPHVLAKAAVLARAEPAKSAFDLLLPKSSRRATILGSSRSVADMILADLGVSSMQLDNPDRGFTYKESGPLDMRMNPKRGETASQLIARLTREQLARVLTDNADEPHADRIAIQLKARPITTTAELRDRVRAAVEAAYPPVASADVETSVRRTFQALRIEVNDELSALDTVLRNLPLCLAEGGRVVILTFHSGEDRRVKKAFANGHREGVYSAISEEVVRASAEERRANPRSSSGKLRWAVRGTQ